MVSNLVVYQLALIALVWLLLILSWLWPSEPAAARPLPPTPVTPPRKRSTAPQPFPGLTRKPHGDACAHTIEDRRLPLPSAPPPKIISTRGRRRHVDTSRHCCPDADCRYGGWGGLGNLQANGHPSGGPWRQLHGTACKGYFQERSSVAERYHNFTQTVWARALASGLRTALRCNVSTTGDYLRWMTHQHRRMPLTLCYR